jgi:hypothetical protein
MATSHAIPDADGTRQGRCASHAAGRPGRWPDSGIVSRNDIQRNHGGAGHSFVPGRRRSTRRWPYVPAFPGRRDKNHDPRGSAPKEIGLLTSATRSPRLPWNCFQ